MSSLPTPTAAQGTVPGPSAAEIPRRARSFWLIALLLGFFLFAASAPSPLYAIYRTKFGFSSITLTAIYAVYAGGALAALLIFGRLSDHVGRRRVVVGALLLQITGMALFIVAGSVGFLFVARILQGAATGAATGALGAWLIDLQPPENPRLGGLVNGVALMAGIGAGALASSVLVQYAPNPLRLVYWLLLAVYMAGLAMVLFIPDVIERRSGALASLRPKVGVPRVARHAFASLSPTLVGTWALGGLYLSLGPSLAALLLNTQNRLAGGAVIAALALAGATASSFVGETDPRSMVLGGSVVLVAGVGITLFAVGIGSTVLLYIGSVIAGLGLGPAFSGVLRSIAPLAPPDKRGALLASLYIVLYLSFSIPTVIAGIAVAHYPLRNTTYVYGFAVMALAAATTVAVSRTKDSPEIAR